MSTLGSAIKLNSDSDENLQNEFLNLSGKVVQFGQSVGVPILACKSSDLPYYSALPPERKQTVNALLKAYIFIMEQAVSEGHSVSDTKGLLWNAIKHFGMVPCSDLMNYVSDGDIIEIYDAQNVQIFRNLKFFEFCSYTLEDLFCRPWHELFIRSDETIKDRLLKVAMDVFLSGKRETRATGIEPHFIEETTSAFNFKMNAEIKYVSPLFDRDGNAVGCLAIEKAQLVPTQRASLKETEKDQSL